MKHSRRNLQKSNIYAIQDTARTTASGASDAEASANKKREIETAPSMLQQIGEAAVKHPSSPVFMRTTLQGVGKEEVSVDGDAFFVPVGDEKPLLFSTPSNDPVKQPQLAHQRLLVQRLNLPNVEVLTFGNSGGSEENKIEDMNSNEVREECSHRGMRNMIPYDIGQTNNIVQRSETNSPINSPQIKSRIADLHHKTLCIDTFATTEGHRVHKGGQTARSSRNLNSGLLGNADSKFKRQSSFSMHYKDYHSRLFKDSICKMTRNKPHGKAEHEIQDVPIPTETYKPGPSSRKHHSDLKKNLRLSIGVPAASAGEFQTRASMNDLNLASNENSTSPSSLILAKSFQKQTDRLIKASYGPNGRVTADLINRELTRNTRILNNVIQDITEGSEHDYDKSSYSEISEMKRPEMMSPQFGGVPSFKKAKNFSIQIRQSRVIHITQDSSRNSNSDQRMDSNKRNTSSTPHIQASSSGSNPNANETTPPHNTVTVDRQTSARNTFIIMFVMICFMLLMILSEIFSTHSYQSV